MIMFKRPTGRRDAGFSFIELLVTIIIAAIAFAALVPVFVTAQQKTSADQLRNQALNVAQDRIEKVRSLSYDQISSDNLNSSSFYNGLLGPTASLDAANGSRTLDVAYSVTMYPAGSTAVTSQYKVVIVSVSWTPPPSPVKKVLLQTVIYRQYVGPSIANLSTDPAMNQDATLRSSSLNIVKFSALPDVAWTGGNTATMHFQVWDNGGTLLADKTVTYVPPAPLPTDSGVSSGAFWWNWDASFAVDGTYKITATAANAKYQGPAAAYYFRINRGSAPGVPAGFRATAGTDQITLIWTAASSTVTQYELFRSSSSAGPWTSIKQVVGTVYSYNDADVLPATKYWYTVRAINASGPGAKTTPVSATTGQVTGDTTAPGIPSGVTAAGDSPSLGVIHLEWIASTDDAGGLGMQDYQIFRRGPNGTGTFTLLATQLAGNPTVYNDSIGSAPMARTYDYYVVARDAALITSGPSTPIVSATVSAVSPIYSLTLQNTQTVTRYAWVQCIIGAAAPFFYPQASGTPQASPPTAVAVMAGNGTKKWSNLPPGTYNIWVSTSSTFPPNPETSAIVTTANVTQTIH